MANKPEALKELRDIKERVEAARILITDTLQDIKGDLMTAESICESQGGHLGEIDAYVSYPHNTILSQLSAEHGFMGNSTTIHQIEDSINEAIADIEGMEDEEEPTHICTECHDPDCSGCND